MTKKKSMIVDHPFWDRIKVKKGTKDPMTGLEIEEFVLPNEKYWKFWEKVLGVVKHD